jgi:hypothetical protein
MHLQHRRTASREAAAAERGEAAAVGTPLPATPLPTSVEEAVPVLQAGTGAGYGAGRGASASAAHTLRPRGGAAGKPATRCCCSLRLACAVALSTAAVLSLMTAAAAGAVWAWPRGVSVGQ